jgi:MFS family permease
VSLTVRQATRRLVVLTALHWLPVGLTTPVMVLLAQDRGLSLADIGLLFTVYGALLTALELPTGGLADVIGRRPVLLAAAALHVLSCLAFATAQGMAGFLGAICLMGVGRALLSGPLEAWYVDTVHAADPQADVAPGLGRQSAADGGGLAVGALLGGALPALLGGSLAAPFLVAAALDLVYVAALLRLLVEDRPPHEGSLRRELATGMRAVPGTVREAVRLSVSDGPLRVVLLLTAVGGVAIVSFELLGPPRFAELAGGRDEGAAVLGTVQAVSFGVAAVGGAARCPAAAPAGRLHPLDLRPGHRLRRSRRGLLRATSVIVLSAVAMSAYFLAHAGPVAAAVGRPAQPGAVGPAGHRCQRDVARHDARRHRRQPGAAPPGGRCRHRRGVPRGRRSGAAQRAAVPAPAGLTGRGSPAGPGARRRGGPARGLVAADPGEEASTSSSSPSRRLPSQPASRVAP